MAKVRRILAAAFVAGWAGASFGAGAARNEVVIIPRPRRIKVAEGLVDLGRARILLEKRSATLKAAAERLNGAIAELGAEPLPVSVREKSPALPDTAILIGTSGGPFSAMSPDGGGELKDKGDQAYSIRFVQRGKKSHVLLVGNGPVGSYYAVVTFRRLLRAEGGRLRAVCADVRDWPDWRWRYLGNSAYAVRRSRGLPAKDKTAFAEKFKRWIDDLADLKINMFHGCPELGIHARAGKLDERLAERFSWMRPLLQYARDRGVYACLWVGSDLAPIAGNENNPLYRGKMQLKGHYFCWSEDELLRRRFRDIGRYMNRMGISFINIHYPDTGNENYQNRCEKCERRFGADRAAADANITKIMVAAIRESCPEAVITLTPHPYAPPSLRYKETEKFLADFNSRIPKGLCLTIRECGKTFVDRWNRVTGDRPLFVYYNNWRLVGERGKSYIGTDWPLIVTNVRYLKTFYTPRTGSIIYCMWSEDPVYLRSLAEYAWNVDAPGGSDAYQNPPVVYEREGRIPEEMVTEIYGRIVRRLFGEEAGRAFTPFFRLPVFPQWVFQPELMTEQVARLPDDLARCHPFKGDLIGRVREQAAFAREAVRIVDGIVERKIPFRSEAGKKIFARYYKIVHLIDRVAPCRLTYLEAKRAMEAGDVAGARVLIARGLAEVTEAADGFEKDLKKIAHWPQFVSGSVRVKLAYGAGHYSVKKLDEVFGGDLRKLALALDNPKLARPKNVVPEQLARKLNATPVFAARTKSPPKIDGRLNDACWAAAKEPVFFVAIVKDDEAPVFYPRAATQARVLYDDDNLYFAFRCKEVADGIDALVGGEGARDTFSIFKEDVLEIFLQPDAEKDCAHFAFNVACRLFDAVDERTEWGFRSVTRWNPGWRVRVCVDADKAEWTAEARIPFAAFRGRYFKIAAKTPSKGDAWRINLGRERRTMECSASSVLSSFHDREKFRKLVFE